MKRLNKQVMFIYILWTIFLPICVSFNLNTNIAKNNQQLDNDNNVNSSINAKHKISAIGDNENYISREIDPSLNVQQIVLIVFSSISASIFIIGGIIISVYCMYRRKVISKKVFTGEETLTHGPKTSTKWSNKRSKNKR